MDGRESSRNGFLVIGRYQGQALLIGDVLLAVRRIETQFAVPRVTLHASCPRPFDVESQCGVELNSRRWSHMPHCAKVHDRNIEFGATHVEVMLQDGDWCTIDDEITVRACRFEHRQRTGASVHLAIRAPRAIRISRQDR